jgi:hypothetical protein
MSEVYDFSFETAAPRRLARLGLTYATGGALTCLPTKYSLRQHTRCRRQLFTDELGPAVEMHPRGLSIRSSFGLGSSRKKPKLSPLPPETPNKAQMVVGIGAREPSSKVAAFGKSVKKRRSVGRCSGDSESVSLQEGRLPVVSSTGEMKEFLVQQVRHVVPSIQSIHLTFKEPVKR